MSQVIGCNFGFSGGGGTGSGTITGSGTPPKIPVFTSPTTIGDSQMSDDGTTVFIGASATSTSAMFEINSTTQGALFPRMTTTQRDAIPVGATEDSLFIFNTSIDKFQFYDTDAGIWQTIESSAIGGETWSQVLTNGATSGGVSPEMSDGDVIRAVNGGGELNLRNGADGIFSLSSDNSGFTQSFYYGDTTLAEWGYSTTKATFTSAGAYTVVASGGMTFTESGTDNIALTNSGTGAINLTTTSGDINIASGTGSWSIAGASTGMLSSSTALSISSSGNSVNIQASNNNLVGIGTSSPTARLEVLGTTGTTSRVFLTRYSNNSASSAFSFKKSRGTEGTPSAVLSGDILGSLAATGYNSGGAFFNQTAAIQFNAAENFTGAAGGTSIQFGTTSIGSTSATTRMLIAANGNVGIGNSVSSVDSSSLFELTSTTQGFLTTRMTSAQRTAIGSPATGLWVYQTDGVAGFYYYNGSSWVFNGIGTDGIYGGSGTVPSATVSTLTDTIDFTRGSFTTTIGGATNYVDITVPVGSANPLSFYEDRVGGASVGDLMTINFDYNDSAGVRRNGSSNITSRVVSTAVGSVATTLTIGDVLQVRQGFGVLVSQGATTDAPIAMLEIDNDASSPFAGCLLITNKDDLASTNMINVRNRTGNSALIIAGTLKTTFNNNSVSTADVQMKGVGDANAFYFDASTARVGIGTATPTAYLNVKAGTATANTAPLKFTTGVLNTTAETGAMEFASDFFYLTANAVRTAISTFGRSVANAATYTALVTDRIIGVTRTTTGTCTVNLPSAALFPDGYQMTIKDEGLNATTNNITIDGSAAQTIDGNLTAIINTDGDSLTIYSNGVDAWFTM